jgi:dihydrofolate reductase
MMRISLVAAVAENGVIGRDNAMPWKISSDSQYFKRITMGKPVIMGRLTHESIGRPLPGRHNIVVSRDHGFTADGVSVVPTLTEALDLARADGAEEAMVIGGVWAYSAALPLADRLYITEVHAAPEGDARFPDIDPEEWVERSRERQPAGPRDDFDYSFVVLDRRGQGELDDDG